MNIRLASMEDFDTISHIYKRARSFMAEHGNPSQWGTNYPSDALIMNDIQHSHLMYVLIRMRFLLFSIMPLKKMIPTARSTMEIGSTSSPTALYTELPLPVL